MRYRGVSIDKAETDRIRDFFDRDDQQKQALAAQARANRKARRQRIIRQRTGRDS